MRILILVLSYQDNSFYTKMCETQRETWDSEEIEDITTFYYFGNCNDNMIIDNNILLSIDEELLNCGHKTIKCLEMIKNLDFDYIVRTNSSSYIDKKLLKNFLIDKPKTNYYAGVVGNHEGIKFSSGSCYILSKDLVGVILENQDKWNHNYIDDVSLSILLSDNGVKPCSAPRFDIEPMTDIKSIPKDYYHYRVKTPDDRNKDCELMKIIYNIKNGINHGE